MKLGNPIRIAEGVFQLRALGARVTVLIAGDEALTANGEALLIDAGMRGSSPLILGGLEAMGLTIDAVKALIITHRHPDHAAGAAELIAGRDIPVMAHPLEAGIISGWEDHPSPFQNRLMAHLARPVIDRLNGTPTNVDVALEDGDVIPFAFPVHVVHLPGHTSGSIALHLPHQKVVIIGDALQYKLTWKLSPPAVDVTEDPKQAMESLQRLLRLDFDAICFSHYPPMRSGGHAALTAMLRQRAA